jgi:hypothetical protein
MGRGEGGQRSVLIAIHGRLSSSGGAEYGLYFVG